MRHIHSQNIRDSEWLKRLEEFIRVHKGKRYRLNPLDLFKSSKSPTEQQEDEGFFCSELVAAAYQNLGLLPNDRLPSKFWPSTLAREDL